MLPKHLEKSPSSKAGLTAVYKRCEPLVNLPMKSIKTKHLQDVVDSMAGMSSQKTLRTVYRLVYKYCLENDIITKDYSAFISLESIQADVSEKYFTKEELTLLFTRHDKSLASDGIMILLYTGMRIGELLGVKCDDVNLEKRTIHVRGTKTVNANRVVPIHTDLLPVIERRLGAGEYLIEGIKDYHEFNRLHYKKHMGALRIKHTPHALRHTFVSIADSHNINQTTLKRIVGHSNKNVTEHYTHKGVDDLINAINKLDFVTYLSLTHIQL